jgi:hypothetical protein
MTKTMCLFLCLAGVTLAWAPRAAADPDSKMSVSADSASGAASPAWVPPQVGIAPGTPQTGTLVLTPPPETEAALAAPSDGAWHFDFHGFLRAPLRLGLGSGDGAAPEAGQGSKVHAPPYIPDGTFTDWRYTNNLPGPWVELRFQYGNRRVTGNVLIAAYNITDGGYRNLQSQLGIDQAFVTLDFSDLFADRGGLVWNVGVFQNRYGAAGRYDAGKYETYLFGRTHVAGETLTAFYRLSEDLTLTLEHGFGAKLEVLPRVTGLPEPNPAYLPYPGPVQQGTQLVHHAHLMLSIGAELQFGAHYMTTWTDDARLMSEVDGRVTVIGLDAKLIDSRYGDAYIGFSHVDSDNPLRVGEGLEVLHSIAGWSLRDNYFGQMSTGSGTIDTLLFQYTLSLARLLRYPEPFWGQGPDILLSVFGMYNHVGSDDPLFASAEDKFKWGAEATYTPLGFLGLGARFDRVQPDLANNTLAFSALSARVILRSEFVTHEQVILQYTRYINGDSVAPAYPAGALPPDENAFMVAAIMWW